MDNSPPDDNSSKNQPNTTNSLAAIRLVNWQQCAPSLTAIRQKVFMEEQQVSREDELDGQDEHCQHVLATLSVSGEPIGCARILSSGKIGRVAVLKPYRKYGIGQKIIKFCIDYAKQNEVEPYLDAQIDAIPFYQRIGFIAEGDVFLDANIPHRRMRYNLSP